jgi:hypothetical protein
MRRDSGQYEKPQIPSSRWIQANPKKKKIFEDNAKPLVRLSK